MKKAILERFKITKNKKVMSRKKGLGHFKAKKSTKSLSRKQGFFNTSKHMKNKIIKNNGNI